MQLFKKGEITQFRKGDVVSVEGVVRYETTDTGRVSVEFADRNDLYIEATHLTLVQHHFVMGDLALLGVNGFETPDEVTIVGIHDDTAWVIDAGGGYNCAKLKDLVRKPAGESA